MFIYEGTNNLVSGAFLKCFSINCGMFASLPFSASYKGSLTRIYYSKLYSLAYIHSYECFLCPARILTFHFDLLLLQLVLCRVVALKSSPVHHQ